MRPESRAELIGQVAVAGKAAQQAAETEQVVAETRVHLASQHPEHARRLRAKRQAAVDQAARERQWADHHAALDAAAADGGT